MRLKRWPKHRLQAAGIAPVAFATCVFALGCQGASYDHTDGASTSFNANRVPSADGPQALASSMSQTKTSASAPADPAAATKPASADSNEAIVAENLNLGHREAALNRFDQAEAYYRRVLEIQPDNVVANHRLAVLADKKGDLRGPSTTISPPFATTAAIPICWATSDIRTCCRVAGKRANAIYWPRHRLIRPTRRRCIT